MYSFPYTFTFHFPLFVVFPNKVFDDDLGFALVSASAFSASSETWRGGMLGENCSVCMVAHDENWQIV